MRIRPFTMSVATLVAIMTASPLRADVVADFEDIALAAGSYHNGDPGGLNPGDEVSHSFVSNGVAFNNTFGIDATFNYPYWSGWAVSSVVDTTTPGFGNQYASYAVGDGNYGVAFLAYPNAAYIDLPELNVTPVGLSAEITNTTYAGLSMLNGDSFSSPFGGIAGGGGSRPDFFKLTITGYAGAGATGAALGTVDFYLADYRFTDNSLDYIVDTWTTVDLTSLLGSRSLGFALTAGPAHIDPIFGLTVPAYFALDNLTILAPPVPEPASLILTALGAAGALLSRAHRRRQVG